MASDILTLLRPSVVTKIVSRVRVPGNVLSRHFGWNIGGKNVETIPTILPQYTYDIYDNVRKVARPRGRYAPAGSVAPNAVGNNTVTFARIAEKLRLDYNQISLMRTLGENAGSQDRMGKRYVELQAGTLRQRHDNAREFLAGSLFRGGLGYIHQPSEDVFHFSYTASGAFQTVDFKFATEHKLIAGSFAAGLQMYTGADCITHTWATASNDIPLMLEKVSAGFQRGVGEPLGRVYLNGATWLNVLQNDKVRQLAGTSSSPFAANEMTTDAASDGSRTGLRRGVIKGMDWLEWFIYDGGIDVYDGTNETYTKLIPDDYALFTTFSVDHTKCVEGGEIIKDNDMAPAAERHGFYSWIMEKADPARFELHGIQHVTLEVPVPKAWAVARVA